MTFLPVVARELRILPRRKSTYWARAGTAVIAVLIMVWVLVFAASHLSYSELGTSLFLILTSVAFAAALLVGMQATADSVSEEKREGTLGLLFLTDVGPMDIVLGKLASASLSALLALIGIIPMLSLALLLGGVSFGQVGWAALVLLNSLFLSLSIGILTSSLCKNEREAMLICFAALFAVVVVPFVPLAAMSDPPAICKAATVISPIVPFSLVHRIGPLRFQAAGVLISVGIQHAIAWACLITASRILPRCIASSSSKRLLYFRKLLDNYVFGKKEKRQRHRAVLLDQNAFLWLAFRERVKPAYAWGITALFCVLLLWLGLQFNDILFEMPIVLVSIFLPYFIFKLWAASEVCSRLIQDRRSGALELLLSSPLTVSEIARGQELALRRIFLKPIVGLFVLQLGYVLAYAFSPRPDHPPGEALLGFVCMASVLMVDLWALQWVGMWNSLFGKSIERVLLATLGKVMALPSVLVGLVMTVSAPIFYVRDQSLGFRYVAVCWWLTAMIISVIFGLSARRNFLAQFRRLAAGDSAAVPERAKRAKPAPARSRSKGRLHFFRGHPVATGITTVLLLLGVFAFGRQLYWKRQVDRQLQSIVARGLPVNQVALGAYFTPVPNGENGLALLESAGPPAVLGSNPTRLWWSMAGSISRPKRTERELTNLNAFLAASKRQVDAFRRLPSFRKAYLDPSMDAWRFQARLLGPGSVGCAELQMALDERDSNRVVAALDSILAFARLLRQQPFPAAQDGCVGTLNASIKAVERALNDRLIPANELDFLARAVDEIDSTNVLARAVVVRRAVMLQNWHEPSPYAAQLPTAFAAAGGLLALVGSADQMLARTLRDFAAAEEWAGEGTSTALAKVESLDLSDGQSPIMAALAYNRYQSMLELRSLFFAEADIRARIGVLQTALAAERFRAAHGTLPVQADDLIPAQLPSLPIDPYNGESIVIERNSDGVRVKASMVGSATRSRGGSLWGVRAQSEEVGLTLNSSR